MRKPAHQPTLNSASSDHAAEPLVIEHHRLGEASDAAGKGSPFANAPERV
jgi:hypothetical protein